MAALLDAGVFVAVDKHDRRTVARLRLLQQTQVPLRTSSAVVAQIWRDGRKQAAVARVLAGVEVLGLLPDNDKRTGELLAQTRTSDVIDAHLALLAQDGDVVLTSDRDDLALLLNARKVDVTIVDT